MAVKLILCLCSTLGEAAIRTTLGIARGPFGGLSGGALPFSSPKQASIHTPVVHVAAKISYGLLTPLEKLEAGLHRLSYVNTSQLRFCVVVPWRSAALLERVLARYNVVLRRVGAP